MKWEIMNWNNGLFRLNVWGKLKNVCLKLKNVWILETKEILIKWNDELIILNVWVKLKNVRDEN